MAALAKSGYRLLIPYGDFARYDVVIVGEDGEFARVQIKTGRLRKGTIEFHACSSHTHRGGVSTRSYVGHVEFFGVYCPQVDRCFLVPASEVNTFKSLRLEPTRNGQTKRIQWAQDYALSSEAPKTGRDLRPKRSTLSGLMPL